MVGTNTGATYGYGAILDVCHSFMVGNHRLKLEYSWYILDVCHSFMVGNHRLKLEYSWYILDVCHSFMVGTIVFNF